jgi:hypothetical protein
MSKSFDIDLSEYVPFERVTDEDLAKARIFNKCRMSDTGCWLWSGPTNGKGYGIFYVGNKDRSAHRISYEVFKGPIPSGLHVLHRCDTPLCVNPAHLRAGTVKENMAERDARGRRDVRGERIGTAKLTEQQVVEIKQSNFGLKALSEKYGVEAQSIWRIRTGKSWAHVKIPQENVDAR